MNNSQQQQQINIPSSTPITSTNTSKSTLPSPTKMPQTATIGFEQLSKYFHLPINDVAKELGICATMLKKICRRNGIPRWPHRKIKSLNKMIENLEQSLQNNPSEAEDCIKQEISILKSKKVLIMKNPSILASSAQKRSAIMGETSDTPKVKKVANKPENNNSNNNNNSNTQNNNSNNNNSSSNNNNNNNNNGPIQQQQNIMTNINNLTTSNNMGTLGIIEHHHNSSPSSSISTPPPQQDQHIIKNSMGYGQPIQQVMQQQQQQNYPQHHQQHPQQHQQMSHNNNNNNIHGGNIQSNQPFSINQLLTPNNPFAVTPLTSYLLDDEDGISQEQQQQQPTYMNPHQSMGYGQPPTHQQSPQNGMSQQPKYEQQNDMQPNGGWYPSPPQQQQSPMNGNNNNMQYMSSNNQMFSQVLSSPDFGFTLPKINVHDNQQQQQQQNMMMPNQNQYMSQMPPQYQQQQQQQQQHHQPPPQMHHQQMHHQQQVPPQYQQHHQVSPQSMHHQQQQTQQSHHQQQVPPQMHHQQHMSQMQPNKNYYVQQKGQYMPQQPQPQPQPQQPIMTSPPSNPLRWVMEHEKRKVN